MMLSKVQFFLNYKLLIFNNPFFRKEQTTHLIAIIWDKLTRSSLVGQPNCHNVLWCYYCCCSCRCRCCCGFINLNVVYTRPYCRCLSHQAQWEGGEWVRRVSTLGLRFVGRVRVFPVISPCTFDFLHLLC